MGPGPSCPKGQKGWPANAHDERRPRWLAGESARLRLTGSEAERLDVEAHVENIAVLDDVVLAFNTQLTELRSLGT